MTRASDKALLRRYHEEGDLAAREQLIEQYLSLVRSLARRYAYRGEQLDDLVQIGCIGLIKAIDRFDIDRGVELTTYATPNIIGEIKRHFRDKGWAVRVPRGLQELNVQLSKIVEEQTVQLGRSPTIPELAKAAGVEEELVLEALESGRAYTSLSLSAGGSDEDGELDPLESLGTEEHQYSVSEDRAVLAPGFRALDERERRILHLRFFDGLTQSQIAQQVGISQMHVSRLIRRALEKIRDEIATDEQLEALGAEAPGELGAPYNPGVRTSAELREGFLSFLEEKGHKRLPSWPLIPRADDHSTLLTTAGMQPQMPYFLGREEPPAPLTATSQKCFRTQDIDEVGNDGHHLTFFEMLGNFSFGQYFKPGAIELAKEFVVERLGLDWDRIWVTVHAGDPAFELGPDEVAIREWEAVGMPSERIVALPSAENFWSVGGPGPCGPDSEIYWDWGAEHGCGDPACAPACPRCDRFLEFWNLVFMEYEQHGDGTLTPLPKQNIDTGHGARAPLRDRPGRPQPLRLRDRRLPGDHGLGRAGERRRVRRLRRGDEGAPDPRRPRPRDDVPRRRRRHALQRGPRLRAPPDRQARRPPGAHDRARRSLADQRRRHRADGPVVPGAGREPRPHPRRAPRRGGAVHRDARAWDEALRGGRCPRRDLRQGRLRPHGHLRLPVRADEGARARARDPGRRRGLPAADDRAPRDLARRHDRDRRPGRGVLGHGRLPHRVRRLREDGRADPDRRARAGRRRPLPREAARVALLSGGRRPGLGPGRDRARGNGGEGGAARGDPARRRPGARLRGLRLCRRRPRPRRRAVERPLPDDGEPHRDAPPPRVAAEGARRPRPAGRLGGASRTSSGSTSRTSVR